MDTSNYKPDPAKAIHLRTVTRSLKNILLKAESYQIWVRAQLVVNKVDHANGRLYGEFVDIDQYGQTVAKMKVVIWREEYQRIKQKLAADGQPDALKGNSEICALCAVRFNEVHGLQLQIFDVDPAFGESHIERNRHRILKRLKADGVLDANKSRLLTRAPLRIGLITSKHSAAHADFSKTLRASPYAFRVLLASASMQGQGTSAEVVAAISSLIQAHVDVICLVRGGGSPIDLAWFDDDAIARAIVQCPVPVWVGIGHEIDVSVPDFVAHTRHKTPTAVAEALVALLRVLDRDLVTARERLLDVCTRRLELAQRAVLQNDNGLRQGIRKHLEIHDQRFQAHALKVESSVEARMSGQIAHLAECFVHVQERVRAQTELMDQGLENARRRFREGAWRRLQQAEGCQLQNLNGLIEGTRKHLNLNEERYHRWVEKFRGSVDRTFDARLARLAAKAIQLQDKVQGSQDREERDLYERQDELLAAFSRLIKGQLGILDLKTSRFNLAQYERFLDQMLRNLEEKQKRLDALSPEQLLTRGYSLTRDEQGRILRSADEVQAGQTIFTQLARGELASVVTKKEGSGDDGR